MTRSAAAGLALLLLAAAAQPACTPAVRTSAAVPEPEVVRVAQPTGEREADRASIVAALERVRPGGTVQFAPGTYLVGEYIQVSIPRLTFLGHPTGTTLRGCDSADYEEMERELEDFVAAGGVGGGTSLPDLGRCGLLELTGGQQTVRGLTFEHSYWGLILGCCHDGSGYRVTDGGHLVEGNTFRSSMNGIRAGSDWPEPSLIRENRFIDVHSPIGVLGRTFHVLNNEISVREPERVILGHPGVAIAFGAEPFAASCEKNVVAGNRIEGHPDGILLYIRPPGSCRDNIIRDNTIMVRRVWLPASSRGFWVDFSSEDDRSVVGVPLSLQVESGEGGILADNLIEGNRIIGGEGVAIEVLRAARTRIVNNTITGITVRDPFPGNTLWGGQERWREANGSAIWISPGSDANEIAGNVFEDIAGAAVVLKGDSNLVITSEESVGVRDLGAGNRVTTGAATSADPQPVAQRPRTITERLVDVGGFQMQVWTGGPEPSEGGPPLVVFENGRAGIAGIWAEVAEEVGSFAPFLAYNRGGRGLSEWDGEPPTPEHVARRLRDLLDVLDLSPPYLLVGHSWGANLVREHAALHPDAVVGLVYVDPYAPGAVERAFETAGFGPLVAEFTDFLGQRPGPVPDPLHLRMDRELGSGAPPDIPVVLMVGLKEGPPPPGAREWMVERGIDPDEILAARRELKVPCLSSMALEVPRGKIIATPFSGHDIQQDEPELVVEAIRWVLSRMLGSVEPGNGQATELHVPLQSQESP